MAVEYDDEVWSHRFLYDAALGVALIAGWWRDGLVTTLVVGSLLAEACRKWLASGVRLVESRWAPPPESRRLAAALFGTVVGGLAAVALRAPPPSVAAGVSAGMIIALCQEVERLEERGKD